MISNPRILPEPNDWTLVETFFRALREFEPIFNNYEARVVSFADQAGVDRRHLRLDALEVSQLLDFETLETLRDGALYELKAITHVRLRDTTHKNRDKLDRYANELFHNMSILKEVQYMISTFAPLYDRKTEQREYDILLAEVHEEFPTLVHRLQALFRKAQKRVEKLLPSFRDDNRVFLRSLYLYGAEVFEDIDSYPGGVEDIYRLVYPEGGAVQGYLEVADSFRASGFTDQAREAVGRGIQAYFALEDKLERGDDEGEGQLFQKFFDRLKALDSELGSAAIPAEQEAAS